LELVAEVEPTRSREKLEKWIPPLKGLVDWIDIPESPLGVARAHSIAVAHYIQRTYSIPSIAHIRVSDVNRVGLRSLVGAAVLLGVKRVVLLRGDKASDAEACKDLSPEEALREVERHGLGAVEGGLLVSARKTPGEIEARISSKPSFILVLNATPQRMETVARIARRYAVRVYPYLIVETQANRWLIRQMPPYVPRYTSDGIVEIARKFAALSDGLIVSVPGDYEGLHSVVEAIRSNI